MNIQPTGPLSSEGKAHTGSTETSQTAPGKSSGADVVERVQQTLEDITRNDPSDYMRYRAGEALKAVRNYKEASNQPTEKEVIETLRQNLMYISENDSSEYLQIVAGKTLEALDKTVVKVGETIVERVQQTLEDVTRNDPSDYMRYREVEVLKALKNCRDRKEVIRPTEEEIIKALRSTLMDINEHDS